MATTKQIGPLQFIVLGFEKPKFSGAILSEINKLREHKVIRVVDALAVSKEADGTISSLQVSDLTKDQAAEYGAVIGYLIGIGSRDKQAAKEAALGAAMQTDIEYEYGITPEELQTIAEDIPQGGAALTILLEHLWTLPLRQAVRDAGGMLIAQDFLSPETLIGIGNKTFKTVAH